jgi:hypothetical protein
MLLSGPKAKLTTAPVCPFKLSKSPWVSLCQGPDAVDADCFQSVGRLIRAEQSNEAVGREHITADARTRNRGGRVPVS